MLGPKAEEEKYHFWGWLQRYKATLGESSLLTRQLSRAFSSACCLLLCLRLIAPYIATACSRLDCVLLVFLLESHATFPGCWYKYNHILVPLHCTSIGVQP